MRRGLWLLMLAGSPAAAQINTNCQTTGGITNCQTTDQRQSGIDWQGYARAQADSQQRLQNSTAAAIQAAANRRAVANQGAANRRAEAYSKVGDLIASGKCEDAKRLAAFYGKADIVADTAKACP